MADRPLAVVVTFDQFPASILGCYGNEWIETPHLDRLAAEGLVADLCWAAQIGPATADEAFGLRESSLREALSATEEGHASILENATLLVQEAGAQIDFSRAGFHKVQTITGAEGAAIKPDQVPLARLVRAAVEARRQGEGHALVWLHARGVTIPATPPTGFAELYQEEFEERGVRLDELPDAERPYHPSRAAGMVSLLDHWLGELFQHLVADAHSDPVWVLMTAAQGSAWQRGPQSWGRLDALRGPSVHVPLILASRGTQDPFRGLRTASLLSTSDVGALIVGILKQSREAIDGELARLSARHEGAVVTRGHEGGTRVTTTEWGAIFPGGKNERELLFRKPEDYWEVNDVSGIEREILETLRRVPCRQAVGVGSEVGGSNFGAVASIRSSDAAGRGLEV